MKKCASFRNFPTIAWIQSTRSLYSCPNASQGLAVLVWMRIGNIQQPLAIKDIATDSLIAYQVTELGNWI
jgi:hypothetical protein